MTLLLALLLAAPPFTAADTTRPAAPDSVLVEASTFDRGGAVHTRGFREMPPDSILAVRLGVVTGGLAVDTSGHYLNQRHAWWADEHDGPFHFHGDGEYSEHLTLPDELPELGLRGVPPDSLSYLHLGLVTGALTAGTVGAYLYQRHLWWADEHLGGFRFHTDGGISEHIDKVAHLHATYMASLGIARSLRLSGLSPETSALWGSIAAWLVQLNVEIRDGFSDAWGFDPEDLLANTIGAGWFYARERVPALDPFVLKFSYWPSEHIRTGYDGAFGTGPPSPLTDYMGQTYWLSIRVHDLLPERGRDFWPPWLAIAAGVSGDRLYTDEASRSYYLALDVDLERLIPVRTWLAAVGLEAVNTLKLPTPTIRLHPRLTPYMAYFGQQ